VTREDASQARDIGDQRASGQGPDGVSPVVLAADERTVLDILVGCGEARTAAQLVGSCGLPRDQVAQALADLRTKGLVTRFNTLVESYAARFPGLEV
jgi:hypothetical protein